MIFSSSRSRPSRYAALDKAAGRGGSSSVVRMDIDSLAHWKPDVTRKRCFTCFFRCESRALETSTRSSQHGVVHGARRAHYSSSSSDNVNTQCRFFCPATVTARRVYDQLFLRDVYNRGTAAVGLVCACNGSRAMHTAVVVLRSVTVYPSAERIFIAHNIVTGTRASRMGVKCDRTART